ncbi:MAG: hypothetical protein JO257_12970 [Deltaproteobacteria bacterium]|nr:hypothetical protein [Deltaproteobacteria bacterium]
MATPNYKGAGQPSSSGGSWLATLVGGTPAYKSVDKGASHAAGYTGAGPAYKPAPAAAPSPAVTQTADPNAAQSAEQSEAYGCGPIAIVIPREVIEQQ